MFPTRRRHPLQTFRFWFLVFGAATVTVAWRFDMLPFRIGRPESGRKAGDPFAEVVLSEPTEKSGTDTPVRRAGNSSSSPSTAPLFASSGPPQQNEPAVILDEATVPASEDSGRGAPVRELFSESGESQPSSSAASRRPPRPTEAHAVADGGSRVVQAASVSDPFAEREAPPVQRADLDAPTIDFTEIDRLSQSNSPADHIEAHRSLSQLYWQQPESRGELRQRIDTLSQRIYFQQQPHYMPAYEIQPGDTLQAIGKRYDVPWQYLAKLNRLDPQRIRAGQRIKVIKGPFAAIIDLSDFELTVHAHGYYVTRYAVGIGKDGSTPIGTFTVQNKQVDPTYYGPDGVIGHDDPANPLGERWIDIGDSYGIHGTIDPGSIGRSESRGCIRMHNDDVAALYDLLGIGSEVTIRE